MNEETKKYKCSHCGKETDTLLLGEMQQGCLDCGYPGFKHYSTPETDALSRFLYTGHF